MIRNASRPQTMISNALLALAHLAAVGCSSDLTASPERPPAAAVAVQSLKQGPASRLYAAFPSDPIASVGHGAIVTSDGTVIVPTPEFVGEAQQYYLDRLLSEASPSVLVEFEQERLQLEAALGTPQEFAVRAQLIRWLIERVQPQDNETLTAKTEYLATAILEQNITGDMDSRSAYQAECSGAGVPIPPDWDPDETTSAWKMIGPLFPDFLNAGETSAAVWYYQSTAPRGLCIALPRSYSNGVIKLLGVICQGNDTSKACFWDNARKFEPFEKVKMLSFGFNAGRDLKQAYQGTCTNCHRGENAFIVHPDTALDIDARVHGPDWVFDLDTSLLRARDQVTPIVHDDWLKVPEIGRELTRATSPEVPERETSCMDCHTREGKGGRLGRIDNLEYCSIMTTALDDADLATMPPKAHLERYEYPAVHREFIRKACEALSQSPSEATPDL